MSDVERLRRELEFIKCDHCGFGKNDDVVVHCEKCEPVEIIRRLQKERDLLESVAVKARGLVRTAFVPSEYSTDEILVVRSWWDSLTRALGVVDESRKL